jgi:hypothetical protein
MSNPGNDSTFQKDRVPQEREQKNGLEKKFYLQHQVVVVGDTKVVSI